jgi:hypothetical protein
MTVISVWERKKEKKKTIAVMVFYHHHCHYIMCAADRTLVEGEFESAGDHAYHTILPFCPLHHEH